MLVIPRFYDLFLDSSENVKFTIMQNWELCKILRKGSKLLSECPSSFSCKISMWRGNLTTSRVLCMVFRKASCFLCTGKELEVPSGLYRQINFSFLPLSIRFLLFSRECISVSTLGGQLSCLPAHLSTAFRFTIELDLEWPGARCCRCQCKS